MKQRKTEPVISPKASAPSRWRSRWIAAALALALVASACSDEPDAIAGDVATGDLAGTTADTDDGQQSDDQSNTGQSDTDQSNTGQSDAGQDDADGDGGDGSASGDGDADDADQDDSGGDLAPGQCALDQVNTELFYAVTNIPEDDPDGGLNIRSNLVDGEVLATVVEGTVVYVEDCVIGDDGGTWFAVTTADDVNGWANAAFLTDRIPASEPTFEGDETAAKVEAVLDALAARRWEVAAEELTVDGFEFFLLASLVGEPGPPPGENDVSDEDGEGEEAAPSVAELLQTYCSVRICDAPYSIVDVRGSYVPSRVSPEVDVSFTYSGGIVTETFGRISGDGDDFTLDSLPGQSILAFSRTRPTAAQLATGVEDAPSGALDAAESVRRDLLAESGPGISDEHMPEEGVVLSSNAFIAPVGPDRQVVTGQDLAAGRSDERLWGYTDGVGMPIVESIDEWMAGYRRSSALLEPDVVGVNDRIGLGNTIDNLAESFPDATIVEFHRAGRGELSDFNWSSVRFALELRDREWKVVAITLDTWTI